MTPIIGELLQATVGKVVDRLTDKFLPGAMSEQEKAAFRLEAARLVAEEAKAAASDMRTARELAGKESDGGPSWTKVLTVTHRPAWSFLVLALFAWTVIAPYLGYAQMAFTEMHRDVMLAVIAFYFGGRSIEKISGTVWGK